MFIQESRRRGLVLSLPSRLTPKPLFCDRHHRGQNVYEHTPIVAGMIGRFLIFVAVVAVLWTILQFVLAVVWRRVSLRVEERHELTRR